MVHSLGALGVRWSLRESVRTTIGARHSNIAGSTISEISESTILKDNPKILDL